MVVLHPLVEISLKLLKWNKIQRLKKEQKIEQCQKPVEEKNECVKMVSNLIMTTHTTVILFRIG